MEFKSNSSRIGTAVLVVLLVIGLTVPLFVAADSKEANEPNDVQEAATPIDGTSTDGELSQPGGIDWYSKEFSEGDTVSFALTKSLWDQGLEVSLHAPNGTELDNSSAYQAVEKTELSATASQSGEYALKIESIHEKVYGTPYTIYAPASEAPAKKPIELESGIQQENESNDNRSKAQPITREEITGEFSDTDDIEWYTVPVKEGEEVSILFTKEKSDSSMHIRAYDPGIHEEYASHTTTRGINKLSTRVQMVAPVEQNGSVNIKLKASSDDEIEPFEYSIQVTKTQQSDSSSGSEDATTTDSDSSDSEDTTATTESDDSETQTDDTATQTPDTDTTDASTGGDEEGATSQFGPGFTGPAALVALFVTALFALGRRGNV